MKKVYEAPEMLIETVCVEMMLAASDGTDGISIFGGSSNEVGNDNADDVLLGKDRDDNDFGGLW